MTQMNDEQGKNLDHFNLGVVDDFYAESKYKRKRDQTLDQKIWKLILTPSSWCFVTGVHDLIWSKVYVRQLKNH